MFLWRLAWGNLKTRPVQHILTLLVVALGVAFALGIGLVADGVEQGLVAASQPFDMVVGAKGSSIQLMFNTVFLQDAPVGNIDYKLYEELKADPQVAQAVPLGLGDNYQGYRILGTIPEFFNMLKPGANAESILQLAEGRFFAKDQEAVIGARVADTLNLKVGDQFQSSHGVVQLIEEEYHEEYYRVVGILEPSGGPYDQGIFVSLSSLWAAHEHKDSAGEGESEGREVTAVLVKPLEMVGLYQLYQEINLGDQAQAAFPGAVMGEVFQFLGQSQRVLEMVSYLVIVLVAVSVVVSLYWAILDQERDLAVLRAIGARRQAVFGVALLESLFITAGGVILGWVLGHGLGWGVALYLQKELALVAMPAFKLIEIPSLLAFIALGLAAGLWPAGFAYRTPVEKNL